MSESDSTFIGHVDSVKGSVVTVRLQDNIPTLIMIGGESYRIGQIGAFVRIPLGYTQLYAVCTLVGSAAAPHTEEPNQYLGQRWMSITLFGESIGDIFERGVSQYPTIGDEVHLITQHDMRIIYKSSANRRSITVGNIAVSSGIPGQLDLSSLVTRHSAIVGSTGTGKSNLVTVLLEAIATQNYPSARTILIDPHGEYVTAIGKHGYVFKINPDESKGELPLYVPFWALPFDELRQIALGDMQPSSESSIRDRVTELKKASAEEQKLKLPATAITADSPIPFSIKRLWFEFDDYERKTFMKSQGSEPCEVQTKGDPEKLKSNEYPKPNPGGQPPHANPTARRIGKQLELLKSRILDARFQFLFKPGEDFEPSIEGQIKKDLDDIVKSWVGHDRAITVLDVSGLPSEVLTMIVGTLLRIIYDMLFWAKELPVGGRKQPLLIVLEEAHIFLPEGSDSPAHRTVSKIAKEGLNTLE